MTDIDKALARVRKLREIEKRMTKGPWTTEVEEYEAGSGTISINEINRVMHDPDWTDWDEWERDLSNADGIVALRNAAPAMLYLLEALLQREHLASEIDVEKEARMKIAGKKINAALASFVEGKDGE